jgi:hypothetical protein
MPSSKVHSTLGIVVSVILWYAFHYYAGLEVLKLAYLPLFVLYTILPDLDIPNSKIAPHFKKFCVLGAILGGCAHYLKPNFYILLFSIFCGVLLVMSIFTTHRKFFHSPIAAVLLSAPLVFINVEWAAVAFSGYIFHLLIDGELLQGGIAS